MTPEQIEVSICLLKMAGIFVAAFAVIAILAKKFIGKGEEVE